MVVRTTYSYNFGEIPSKQRKPAAFLISSWQSYDPVSNSEGFDAEEETLLSAAAVISHDEHHTKATALNSQTHLLEDDEEHSSSSATPARAYIPDAEASIELSRGARAREEEEEEYGIQLFKHADFWILAVTMALCMSFLSSSLQCFFLTGLLISVTGIGLMCSCPLLAIWIELGF